MNIHPGLIAFLPGAGAQDELMQSLDYKLKTSNTSYVTARRDVQTSPAR